MIKKTFSEMVSEGISFLARNTNITYFSDGSIAKALVEATALEIFRLQNFVANISENSFLGTSTGVYLDLFGQMLGLPRLVQRVAFATAEDSSVRFFVTNGTLGSRLPHSTDTRKGLVPANTTVTNAAGTVLYTIPSSVEFPINSKSVYVPVVASDDGSEYNIGAGQLTRHNLSNTDVQVTNDTAIVTGGDVESDNDYRYRLSKAMSTRFGANRTAVQVAATTQPSVIDARVIEFARGAGTFDVLLIPKGNRVTNENKQNALRAINQVIAFGIYPSVREPEYVRLKVIVQLRYKAEATEGIKAASKQLAQTATLNHLSTIPLGGELIINQLRSSILSALPEVVDLNILEICLNGRPKVIRNIKLKEDELFIPDDTISNPIVIV